MTFETTNINIKVERGKEGLSSIRNDWEYIANLISNKRFFHFYQWYKSYIDSLGNDDLSVYFFLFYENNKPIAIFPLKKAKKKILGLKFDVLEIPDHPHIELSDFIIEKAEKTRGLIVLLKDYLKREKNIHWDFIYLQHVLEDSLIFDDLFLPIGLVERETVGKCNYLSCVSYNEIHDNLSRNFRGNLRKARNKLLRFDNMEFVSVRKGKELFRDFEEFLDIEASGWKGEKGTGTAIKLNPEIEGFYKCLLENYSKINGCEINLLKVNGECIAGQFCLLADDTVYVLKIGYKEKHSKIAPGNMLLENLIKRLSKDENIKYINLITDYKWHDEWKPLSLKVFAVYIFNKTPRALIALILTKAKRLIRPFKHYMVNQIHKAKIKTHSYVYKWNVNG